MNQRHFDEELKSMFQMAEEDVKPSKNLYDNILHGIKQEEEKNMKNIFSSKKMKGFVIAAVVCMVSVSCYAASKIYSLTSSSGKEFTEPPTIEQMKDSVGFSAKYVEKFANGFIFENAGSGIVKGNDENGQELVSFKQLNFMYKNADIPNAFIALNTRELEKSSSIERMTGEATILGEISAQYSESHFKFYPPNVEVSAEDLKLQEEGKLEISYGSTEIEESFFQTLEWEQDGIIYELMLSNVNADKAEIVDMAKEIIAMQ